MKKEMSRRNFLKGAATGAVGMATVGLMGCGTSAVSGNAADAASLPFEKTISWSAEYDVIVLGLGLAGGATAIAAADEGAKVLIIEKAPKGEDGGNSKYSGQGVLYVRPENRDSAIKYFQAIRGKYNTPGDDILEAFTDKIITNQDWIIKHGGNAMHFADRIGEFHDIPGYDLMSCWSIDATIHDGKLFNFVRKYALESDSIDVWFDAPAQTFIQDTETGIVHGVKTSVNGQEYNIRALNGIVLCTGGFENSIQMIQDYHQLPYAYAKGALYNTGDGIKMAMGIGADLWHMSNIAGPDLNAIDPTTKRAVGYAMMGKYPLLSTGFTCGTASIIIGADGTRFVDEGTMPGHGFIHFHGMKLRMPVSLPAYCVFDSTAIDKTIYKSWDNQDKVKDGTIITAGTLDELAAKLGLPKGSLSSTVTQYNEFCAKGQDVVFNKKAEYLVPFSKTGPYYAFEVFPTYTNTQGGPRRSAGGEILNIAGNPIPHLYSAGECGSIWGDIYQGAGNLSECISFGRISGANAAAAKTDNLRESAVSGTPVNFNVAAEADRTTAANEFTGTGNGIGGDVTIKMTVNDKKITAIDVLKQSETENIGGAALDKLVEQALAAQGPKIDGVSGATVTSDAFKAALTEAMTKAGI